MASATSARTDRSASLYLGNVEIVREGGVTTTRRTVAGVAVQTIVGSTTSARYLFHDRLGSVVVATHPQGTVAERFDYQPFGGRRDPGNPDAASTQGSNITPRGLTGHEMLELRRPVRTITSTFGPLTRASDD